MRNSYGGLGRRIEEEVGFHGCDGSRVCQDGGIDSLSAYIHRRMLHSLLRVEVSTIHSAPSPMLCHPHSK